MILKLGNEPATFCDKSEEMDEENAVKWLMVAAIELKKKKKFIFSEYLEFLIYFMHRFYLEISWFPLSYCMLSI